MDRMLFIKIPSKLKRHFVTSMHYFLFENGIY